MGGKAVHPGARCPKRIFTYARKRYESTKISFAQLAEHYGLSQATFQAVAKIEGWEKYEPPPTPGSAADTVWAENLRPRGPGTIAPTPVPRRVGRPSKLFLRMANASPETPEQLRMARAQADYETGHYTFEALAEKYGFSVGKLRYWARELGWVKAEPPPPDPAPEITPNPPPKPESVAKGWSAVKAASDIRTADIIDFPAAAKAPQKIPEAIELLPEISTENRQQLRTTLAAIRASMSVDQVQRLARHTNLLARYSHLLEVYLEPHRFVITTDLTEDQKAERITTAQKVALRMLLPTDRDTLAGAIKTMTEALARTIGLERMVAGLHKVAAGGVLPDPEDLKEPSAIDVDGLQTEELRGVQYAMEMLDRHHRKQKEPPKPPPPASIDDLLGPEPVVVKEPGDDETR